ncbi:unnamed protein product [Tetraodon nigroviridis]|uniref:(spotted green pufferfish) hypothetical protein n=1 Tax=Tetraodon nigroviridis TaxID=99883 RepID=Q4S285_TETNG|nr:unnamed protein product [Tetraodon nigroviridis]
MERVKKRSGRVMYGRSGAVIPPCDADGKRDDCFLSKPALKARFQLQSHGGAAFLRFHQALCNNFIKASVRRAVGRRPFQACFLCQDCGKTKRYLKKVAVKMENAVWGLDVSASCCCRTLHRPPSKRRQKDGARDARKADGLHCFHMLQRPGANS